MYVALIALGLLFAAGMIADLLGRRIRLPRVTLLLLLGVAFGHLGFGLVPEAVAGWYDFLSAVALTMIAFLLGGALSSKALRQRGRDILTISLSVTAVSLLVVAGGLLAMGVSAGLALLLAGVATATAPAATQDVIRQTGASGGFTDTLRGIVAIDDAWGLLAFSVMLAMAQVFAGNHAQAVLWQGLWDIGGALCLGVAIGLPAALLSGRLRPGEPTQAETLAIVFLCAGLAGWLGVSLLLTGIVAGAVVVNVASHHDRTSLEIEELHWPVLILFFFLAGATLHLGAMLTVLPILTAFVILRTAARLWGGWLGAWLSGTDGRTRRWIGPALLPQAGVAIGMALVARDTLPELGDEVLAVTVASAILFELVGPVGTMIALRNTGQTRVRRLFEIPDHDCGRSG